MSADASASVTVTVTSPSRLHFTLIDLNGELNIVISQLMNLRNWQVVAVHLVLAPLLLTTVGSYSMVGIYLEEAGMQV